MLKRKMWDVLEKWVSESRNKCLVIEGARQVGKTFIIREFGKHRFESFIELKQPPAHSRDFSRELAGFYGQNN